MRFPAKTTSSWVAYLSIELFYIGIPVVRTNGGRAYDHLFTKISWPSRLPHFLRYGATLARARSSAIRFLKSLFLYVLL